jgi:serine protease
LETPPFNQTSELSASSQSQDTENFVPGELIVTFHQEQDAGLIDRGTALTTKTSQGDSTAVAYRLRETLGGASYTVDLQLDSFSKTLAVEDRASLLPGKFVDEEQRLRYLTVMASRDFAQDRAVKSTSLNYIRSAAAVPNDPMYANQRWHYEQVNLPAAWDISTGSPDVVVAVVDSGVSAHPDLVPNLLAGYDFVSSDPQGDGDGEDSDPSDPGKWVSAGPRSSHGTHVAGTVAARGNNSIGVTGASWSTSILPVRALGAGGTGTDSDIIRGIRYAAGLLPDRKPPKIANIINLSLGASNNFCPSSYLELFKELRALGIIIVAANGNGKANGTNFVSSPANCAGVVSVAATDSNRNITFYSQEGSETDLAAPGGSASFLSSDGVYSTNISRIDQAETQYIFNALSGTSMAAPHVAGIISLMKAVRPSLTPVEFESLVASGYLSNDIGTPGRDNASGYGLIDARKAVSVVSGTLPNIPPRIEVLSTRLDFGAATVTLPVIVTVIGNATSPTTVTADLTGTPPWVKVATPQQLNDRTYSFNVSVDRGLAFNGVFQTSIAFKATAGSATVSTVNVPLSMSKPSSTAIGDGGSQYAVLVEAKTGRTTLTNLFRPRGASFAFTMVGAPRGTYYLFAGTDVDNNLRICEPGELCSVYEVNVGTPREFLIDRPIRGIGITMRLIDVTTTSSFAAGPYNLAGQLLDMGVSRNLGESSSGYYRLLGMPSP